MYPNHFAVADEHLADFILHHFDKLIFFCGYNNEHIQLYIFQKGNDIIVNGLLYNLWRKKHINKKSVRKRHN